MAYEKKFAIRAMPITATGFTDIVSLSLLPIDCNTILVMNDTGQAITLATDPNNPNSTITINDGQSFTIGGAVTIDGQGPRFPAGSADPAGSLKASSSPVSPLIISIL